MDVQSLRMMLGWSREELAKRSGVSFASVYLIERMETAGAQDDALIVRTLISSHRSRFPKLLIGRDAVSLDHSNDETATVPAGEPQPEPSREMSQASKPLAPRHG